MVISIYFFSFWGEGGGLCLPDSHQGCAPGPRWGTSVPSPPVLSPSETNFWLRPRDVARNLFWGGIKVFWGGIKCSITVLTSLLPHKKFTWPDLGGIYTSYTPPSLRPCYVGGWRSRFVPAKSRSLAQRVRPCIADFISAVKPSLLHWSMRTRRKWCRR